MNDIFLAIIIIIIIAAALYKIHWDKKNNIKSSACSSCPLNKKCNNKGD